ncbi:NAD+ kinase [Nakamurella sp. UYEF19]|uniref:NAD kinase n=1 Tax=Nakamurella sp. UYEF19 TaxID=1756392 RepID=UPI0033936A31
MTDRRVLLVAHTGRADMYVTATHVQKVLEAASIELLALPGEGRELDLTMLDESVANGGTQESPVELVLALGGDGTLLRAAEVARPLRTPVIAINLGRVGFLAEAEADHLDDVLTLIIDRNYTLSRRMTVDVVIEHEGQVIDTCWALNEISVEKTTRERILDVVIEVDGKGVSAFGCDGVLCATPTGSTAYAFSAGGPIMWPDVEALLVVPSNAHALFARPMVVSPQSTVSMHIDPSGHDAIVTCDGRRTHEVPRGSKVHVRRGVHPVTMIKLGDQSFTDRLVAKFSLPVHGWRGRSH